MLRPKEMTKIVAVGGKKDRKAVVDALYDLKALHIKEHTPAELDIGSPLEQANDISEALIKSEAILSLWDEDVKGTKTHADTIKKTLRTINKIHDRVHNESEELRTRQKRAATLKEELHTHKILSKLKLTPEFFALDSVAISVGTIKDKGKLKEYPANTHTDQHHTYAAIAVPKEDKDKALQDLATKGFTEHDVRVRADEKTVEQEFKAAVNAKREAEKQLAQTKKEYLDYVQSATQFLRQEAIKAQVPLTFAESENIFYVTGYVPTEDVLVVTQELEKAAKKRLHVQTLKEEDEKEIPIKMEHPGLVKDFQFFQNLYALPRYKELDPTFFTFMTFPFLFGLMLGDIGYGIITLILFLFMKKWMPKFSGFYNIIILASVWTILFGIFFGKFFGSDYLIVWELPRVFHRLYDVMEVLYFSLFIGILHINFGLAIGFFNEYKSHGLKMAILEKASWWVLQIAVAIIALPFIAQTLTAPETTGSLWLFEPIVWLAQVLEPAQPFLGYGLLGLAVVMIILGEGVIGAVEIPALVSNILSYARLFAIGMAKASLAVVVNQFANGFMLSMGWWGLIPTTLLLVFGHTINILLGLLGGFLHSLRLHYVEFYSRFYKGGGKRYQPFGTK